MKLYIDGRLAAVSSANVSGRLDLSTTMTLKIGFGEVDYFTGKIREVRLYRRALSDTGVQSLYTMRNGNREISLR